MIFTFDSSQVGAPVLSGSAGALRAVIKACLVDGFGAGPVASITVAAGVATVAFSGSHPYRVGSVIQISAYRKDHQVVVDVADNGPGIPDRAKAQVFEMFYTGQSRIADSHRSLGLGLPLCRAILTAHGGTLTLRDNIPNGSVFSFALPQSEVNIHE